MQLLTEQYGVCLIIPIILILFWNVSGTVVRTDVFELVCLLKKGFEISVTCHESINLGWYEYINYAWRPIKDGPSAASIRVREGNETSQHSSVVRAQLSPFDFDREHPEDQRYL